MAAVPSDIRSLFRRRTRDRHSSQVRKVIKNPNYRNFRSFRFLEVYFFFVFSMLWLFFVFRDWSQLLCLVTFSNFPFLYDRSQYSCAFLFALISSLLKLFIFCDASRTLRIFLKYWNSMFCSIFVLMVRDLHPHSASTNLLFQSHIFLFNSAVMIPLALYRFFPFIITLLLLA